MAVADPRFAPDLPKPPPKWVQAGLSKSQWDKLDVDGKRLALLKAQDQGINPTGDESLPFQWGPLAAKLAQLGYSAGTRQLIKRRLIKDASGKPQPFYHGTSKQFKGDFKPTPPPLSRSYTPKSEALRDRLLAEKLKQPKAFLSTNPKTADYYAYGSPYAKVFPEHARIFPKYLTKEARLSPMGSETYGVATDPSMMIPPWAIAPPPMPNFLPYLAPPVIGSQ